jgi:PAS domain S-box-containing protein
MFPQKQKRAKKRVECSSTRPSNRSKSRVGSVASRELDCQESREDPTQPPPVCRENVPEFVVLLNPAGTICYISPAATSALGYTPEMANGQSVMDFVHPDDRSRLTASLKRPRDNSQGSQSPEEYRVRDIQGNWRSIETVRTDLPMALGGGWAISCRPLATPESADEEILCCLIFETMHDGAIVTDLEGRVLDWNPAAERMFGYQKAEVLGKTPAILHNPEVAAQLTQQILDALQDHGFWRGKISFLRKNGTEGICETAIVQLHDAAGQPRLNVRINRDITARHKVEETLRQERNFVEAVLEMAGALVVVLDRQGRIVRFNRACERLTQYPLTEVKGRCVWDLFLVPEEVEGVKAVFGQLLSSKQGIEYENYWQAKNGSLHWISWSNTVLCDLEGQVKYVIATGLDLTEHQRLEEMRYALEKEKELNQLQSHFFTMASHQFRTPLSTILLSAHSLEQSARDGSIAKRLTNINRIQSAARSLTQMIGDILTIERAEAGHLEFDPHPLDLDVFCRQILEKTQVESGKNHRLMLTTQGELHGILLDKNLIQITIENLLSNAIDYSATGSKIELILINNHRSLKLQVRDQGLGIPSRDLPHVFNPFYRGGNVEKIPGVGLGLTVVKKCVELQGGQISLSSKEGEGTLVTVKITKR